ncbi:preprotein translocase subunit SecY [Candidatus Woesearchaeota archaeon]|nr:MAG: preprotein translocase subunit SecY [Candidatus Woesearchaeota archaeon]
MSLLDNIIAALPEVQAPTEKKLGFKPRLKWTLIILVLFFVMGLIPLFGLGSNALQQFEMVSLILGAEFGSIMSLGIGPIVTASIILQLLNGSGIIKFDTTSAEGKKRFQGVQKITAIFFVVFEAIIYVVMGGLAPGAFYDPVTNAFLSAATDTTIALSASAVTMIKFGLIFQLTLGGIIVMFMDEVISKWGFGSGISLFIAAGVSKSIMIQAFNPLKPEGSEYSIGAFFQIFQSLSAGDPSTALLAVSAILATIAVFLFSIYAQSMKVEIPLSVGRVRGHAIRWPLNFLYTSNIPVILIAALMANIQLWTRLFGGDSASNAVTPWVSGNQILSMIIQQKTLLIGIMPYLQSLVYLLILMGGSVIFSIFWVQTSGMDSRSQAKQMMASGLQIPGFRKDQRILERLLDRYIGPLTVMGGLTVGFLAGLADLTGALSRGTGILLTVMIVYKLYEDIAKQHMYDMNPMMRKFMGK